jgi:hypothetical protein
VDLEDVIGVVEMRVEEAVDGGCVDPPVETDKNPNKF